jgi:hypothetical protein
MGKEAKEIKEVSEKISQLDKRRKNVLTIFSKKLKDFQTRIK